MDSLHRNIQHIYSVIWIDSIYLCLYPYNSINCFSAELFMRDLFYIMTYHKYKKIRNIPLFNNFFLLLLYTINISDDRIL